MTHRFSRTPISALLALTCAVALGACSNNDNAAADHNGTDISFVQDMIPHHSQAVDMAKRAPAQASSERVKSLAIQIQGAQQPEIDTMNGWLKSWGENTIDPSSNDHTAHGTSADSGMMDADEMSRLEGASGVAFDRLFLELMIEHHTGAIETAKAEMANGKSTEARALAASITSSQQAEITEMQQLLTRIP